MKGAVLLCVSALLLLARHSSASVPDCPDDQPFGECASGNPCADPKKSCGPGRWCQRGCGCDFKCLDNDVVTVAGSMMLGVETEGDDIGAIDATAAIVATPSPAPAPAPALAHWPKPTLLPTLGPISLPGRPHLPNITALAEGVHAALSSAVRDAILHAVKVKPVMCPNGKPLVGCIQDSCAAKPCSKSQVCVPTCGSCTTHKCVDVDLPFKIPDLPQLPSLTLPKLPKMSLPRPPCSKNEAMNMIATIKTIPAQLMMSQERHLSISCSSCPNGTVSKQPALTCTLCLPGTYADRDLAICRLCNKGFYASTAGAQFCSPCPANSFAPLPGSFLCIPCPPGFTTSGKRAQSSCAFDATYKLFKMLG